MSSPILEAIIRAAEKSRDVFFNSASGHDEAFIDADLFVQSLREEMEKEPESVSFSNVKEKLVYDTEPVDVPEGIQKSLRLNNGAAYKLGCKDEREKVLETLLSFIDEVAKNRELEGLRMQVEAIRQRVEEMKK